MKCALKSVPGLADVGVPHGDEDAPGTLVPGFGSKIPAYHVDQWEKLKGWDGCYVVSLKVKLDEGYSGQMCFSI